jgi:hypothetical protein
MADATPIRRHEGPLYELGAGEYAVDVSPLTARCVFVSCPRCGGIEEIAVDHGIDDAGAVMPGFECPGPTCGWTGRITLERWAP